MTEARGRAGARKIVAHVPSAEQVVVCNSRLGGDLPRHPARARRHRPPEDHQVPGLLQRLPRLRAPQRAEPRRSASARRDPHSAGMLEAAIDATLVCRFNDLDDVARDARATRRGGRGDHRRADRAQLARAAPAPGLPRGPARAVRRDGRAADLRRGHHRLPARPRRLPGDLRRDARPDHAGQGDRQRLPARGDRRPAASTWSASTRPPTATCTSAAPTTATPSAVEAGARDDRASSRTASVHEHVFALGERMRGGLAEIADARRRPRRRRRLRLAVRAVLHGRPARDLRGRAAQRRRAVRRATGAS